MIGFKPFSLTILLAAALLASPVSAQNIRYNVDQDLASLNGFLLPDPVTTSGFLETDGTIGLLDVNQDIVDWEITVTGVIDGDTSTLTPANSFIETTAIQSLTASTAALSWNPNIAGPALRICENNPNGTCNVLVSEFNLFGPGGGAPFGLQIHKTGLGGNTYTFAQPTAAAVIFPAQGSTPVPLGSPASTMILGGLLTLIGLGAVARRASAI